MTTSSASRSSACRSVSSAPGRRPDQRGFTLLEMLVVLVLTALVVGMVFEGLGRVADLRVRLARHLDGALDETIVGSWFRTSVAALQTDLEGAGGAFRGGEAQQGKGARGVARSPKDRAEDRGARGVIVPGRPRLLRQFQRSPGICGRLEQQARKQSECAGVVRL